MSVAPSGAPPSVTLGGAHLTIADLRTLSTGAAIKLDPACLPGIEASAGTVASIVESGRIVYGINTGFGLLAQHSIPADQLAELQRRLVLSHAAGVGPLLAPAVSK